MAAYKTHLVIADPNHTVLSGLPFKIGQRVQVVLLGESDQTIGNDNALHIVEKEWLHAAASNPAFQFLVDAEEDVYSGCVVQA